jgi:all-trans-retinol 13,14-reductase
MSKQEIDVIIIGSGIGGLACASALAKTGRKVLVLEQHHKIGGLTQTFSRNGYTWDVGLHYLGRMGEGETPARIMDWLSDGRIKMHFLGPIYECVHFPDNFTIEFSSPVENLEASLTKNFPSYENEIKNYLTTISEAETAIRELMISRSLPGIAGKIFGWLKRKPIQKWCGRTTEQVLQTYISNTILRSVLTAQWCDFGGKPSEASFAFQALITYHYLNGAYYPVGGAEAIANGLRPSIEQANGQILINSPVKEVIIKKDQAIGVTTESGKSYFAKKVISDIGAAATVNRLLPKELHATAWAQEIMSFRENVGHICLYLGLEGDILTSGASLAKQSFYESWNTNNAIWEDPVNQSRAPAMFVFFPSLRDPKTKSTGRNQHTASVITMTRWEYFQQWQNSSPKNRPEEYKLAKQKIEQHMLLQFKDYFPELSPLIRYHEISTPLTMSHYKRAHNGSGYGLEMTPRRLLSNSLRAKTPIRGLYLTGQDIISPGITGGMMAGVFTAATIEPRLFKHFTARGGPS